LLAGAARVPAGRLLSLAGLGKVPSWAGWGASSAAGALPLVAALCVAGQLVLMLTSPCAV
jgi:hypothetical protein